ncbi:MAG: diphosphomevalonate/mevalonate 3,5-bisphosphate decarboxylase family protein [Bacteroidales bacterium]
METKYISEAINDGDFLPDRGKIVWESPSNIAFIKYWGKHGNQYPENASLSMSLKNSVSVVELLFHKNTEKKGIVDFTFEGKSNQPFKQRVDNYLQKISDYFPFLEGLHLEINSYNTFPHSSGIASSASFMSALALCLCTLEKFNTKKFDNGFFQKASFMARLGSGSASRSVYGKYAAWGKNSAISHSSDEYAVSYDNRIPENLQTIYDAIIIVDSAQKKISSSQGHRLMQSHFYKENRIQQASTNITRLMDVISVDDWLSITNVIENEALSLHALMLSSSPGYILLKQQTIDIIDAIRTYRSETGAQICFTLDAGPNVHVLYPERDKKYVETFIERNLTPLAENGRIIYDKTGEGPVLKEIEEI